MSLSNWSIVFCLAIGAWQVELAIGKPIEEDSELKL